MSKRTNGGFSLLELLISMTLTVTVMGIATSLLAQALNVRTRTNANTDALADAQRAINIMSREIANAGFNLNSNGIVAGDTGTDQYGNSTIRLRSNINRFDDSVSAEARNGIGVVGEDAGEDFKYFIFRAQNTNLLARYDRYAVDGGSSTVLANRLDSLHVHYFDQRVSYVTSGCDIGVPSASEVAPAVARYVVIAVCVELDQVGTPNTSGFQPAQSVLLVSDVTLRNSSLPTY